MRINTLLLLIILSLGANSQITFEKSYYEEGYFYSKSVIQESDSGFVITGHKINNLNYDGCLLRTDKFGDTLWLKYTGLSVEDHSYSVIKTNDNGYILTGDINAGYANINLNLVKTNSNGDVEWNNNYGGVNWERGYSIIQTNSNDYIIAGYSNSINGPGAQPYDMYIIKTNNIGELIWETKIGGADNDYAYWVCNADSNSCIVAGDTKSFGVGLSDFYLVKLSENGGIVWTKTYNWEYAEHAKCIQPTNDGNYIVTVAQEVPGVGNDNLVLLKINENGDTIWTKTYGGSASYFGSFGVPTNDGGYIFTGGIEDSFSQGIDIILLKTDNFGNLLWLKRFGNLGYQFGKCVRQTNDGGYVISGQNGFAYNYLVKTDSLGCVRPAIDSITGHLNVSLNDTITYSCFNRRGEDYFWETNFGTVTVGQGNDTVLISWDQVGVDTVTVYVSNACGIDSMNLVINVDTCVSPLLSLIIGDFDVYLFDVEEYYVNLIEGKHPVSYLWNVNCGTILSGQNTPSIVVEWDSEGFGSIEVVATNECGVDTQISEDIYIIFPNVEEVKQSDFLIFPNPSNGVLNFNIPDNLKIVEVEVFDLNGRLIKRSFISSGQNQIDMTECQKGIYIAKMHTENKIVTEKILLK